MKKIYESPAFFAEAYSFSDSIAACEYHIYDKDENGNLSTKVVSFADVDAHDGTVDNIIRLCSGNGNCHQFDMNGEYAQSLGVSSASTLFNDGVLHGGPCQFDWGGPSDNVVKQTGQSFAQTFLENSSNPQQHSPGYDGLVFYS